MTVLSARLASRPEGLGGGVTIDRMEILVEYEGPRSISGSPDML